MQGRTPGSDRDRRARPEHRERPPRRDDSARWRPRWSAVPRALEKLEIQNDDFIRRPSRARRGVEASSRGSRRRRPLYRQARGWYCSASSLLYGKSWTKKTDAPFTGLRASGSRRRTFSSGFPGRGAAARALRSYPEFVGRRRGARSRPSYVRPDRPLHLALEGTLGNSLPRPAGTRRLRLARPLSNYITALGRQRRHSLYRVTGEPARAPVQMTGRTSPLHAGTGRLSYSPRACPAHDRLGARLVAARRAQDVPVRRNVVRPTLSSRVRSRCAALLPPARDDVRHDSNFPTRRSCRVTTRTSPTTLATRCRGSPPSAGNPSAAPHRACRDNDSSARIARPENGGRDEDYAFNRALEAVWRLLAQINGYVVAREPWKIRKEEGATPRLERILYAAAEGIRVAAVMLSPFVPGTARRVFATFGLPAEDPRPGALRWGRLPLGVPVPETPPLFPRVVTGAAISVERRSGDGRHPANTSRGGQAPGGGRERPESREGRRRHIPRTSVSPTRTSRRCAS